MQSAWVNMDSVPRFISDTTGAEISGVRLFCTVLYVYPITLVQKALLSGAEPNAHHAFNTAVASLLLYYNFGVGCGYFLANVLLAYVLLSWVKPSKFMVILSFIGNMAYLIIGYASNLSTSNYVVVWTTSHSILTLKLIGIAWDLYDGAQSNAKGKEETAIDLAPTLLELFGFACYPPGLMTGPQISFKKYRHLTDGLYDCYLHSCWSYSLLRGLTGFALMLTYPYLASFLPTEYFYTENFKSLTLLSKMFVTAAWGQIVLSRYVGIWMVAEASCILSGMAFNGKDDLGNVKWDGCTNTLFYRFVCVTQSRHYADAFHVSTNKWLMMYVYKRLKFLKNKYVSHLTSLMFLSIWHGLETGYFLCFFLEFIIVAGEALFIAHYGMGCGLLAFEQLKYHKYMSVYGEMHYIILIGYLSCPIIYLGLANTLQTGETSKKQ